MSITLFYSVECYAGFIECIKRSYSCMHMHSNDIKDIFTIRKLHLF